MRIPLKISVALWTIALVTCIGYVVSRLLVFKQIFFAHAGVAITQPQVAAAFPEITNTQQQHIPKIIHQIFHNWHDPGNDTLPSKWTKTRQTCVDLNPDFEFKVRIHRPTCRR
jgi:mannosyltransferase OCH1-like enzyme